MTPSNRPRRQGPWIAAAIALLAVLGSPSLLGSVSSQEVVDLANEVYRAEVTGATAFEWQGLARRVGPFAPSVVDFLLRRVAEEEESDRTEEAEPIRRALGRLLGELSSQGLSIALVESLVEFHEALDADALAIVQRFEQELYQARLSAHEHRFAEALEQSAKAIESAGEIDYELGFVEASIASVRPLIHTGRATAGEQAAESARSRCEDWGYDLLLAEACFAKSTALTALARFEKAIETCDQGLERTRSVPTALRTALFLQLGKASWVAGDFERTERALRAGFEEAVRLERAGLDHAADCAASLARLYAYQGRFEEARAMLARAENAYRGEDPRTYYLLRLGQCELLFREGKVEDGVRRIQPLLSLNEGAAAALQPIALLAHTMLGEVELDLGNHHSALLHLHQAEQLAGDSADSWAKWELWLHLALSYASLGRAQPAREYASRLTAAAKEAGGSAGQRHLRSAAMVEAALALKEQDGSHSRQALESLDRLGGDSEEDRADFDRLRGSLRRQLSEHESGTRLLVEAERFATTDRARARCLAAAAVALAQDGDILGARQKLEHAQALLPSIPSAYRALFHEAASTLRAAEGDPKAALLDLKQAALVQQGVRRSLAREVDRLGFQAVTSGAIDERIIESCHDHRSVLAAAVEDALSASERSHGRVFLERLSNRSLRVRDSGRLEAVVDQLIAANADLRRDPASTEPLHRREAALTELRGLEEGPLDRSTSVPEIHEPTLAQIKDLARRLDADLLEFFVGRTRAFAFWIGKEGADFYEIKRPSDLEREILSLRDALGEYRSYTDLVRGRLARLGTALFNGRSPPSRLFVVPDGPLHLLPFDLLLVGQGDAQRWLVETTHICLVPSIQALEQLLRRGVRDGTSSPGFLIGAVDHSAEQLEDGTAPHELRFAREEIASCAEVMRDRLPLRFEGKEATKEHFFEALHNGRWLHFAGHGSLDVENPLLSGLWLSRPAGGPDLLTLAEVEREDCAADLVVLSACSTGTGLYRRWEGVQSLTQAFLAAGSRSVIATLWGVQDISSAELMRRFYTGLRQGNDVATALGEAKRELLKSPLGQLDPSICGAYVLHGLPPSMAEAGASTDQR